MKTKIKCPHCKKDIELEVKETQEDNSRAVWEDKF